MNTAPFPPTAAEPPALCHRLLSKAEYEHWLSDTSVRSSNAPVVDRPLTVNLGAARVEQFPAFQLYASLDREMFGVLRATFDMNGRSESDLWNFLRTAQMALGGMTAAEHLLGLYAIEIAQLSKRDRDGVLLELVQEELWRLQQ